MRPEVTNKHLRQFYIRVATYKATLTASAASSLTFGCLWGGVGVLKKKTRLRLHQHTTSWLSSRIRREYKNTSLTVNIIHTRAQIYIAFLIACQFHFFSETTESIWMKFCMDLCYVISCSELSIMLSIRCTVRISI